eukprot:jgi/Tetstr1/442045/TSEL_030226.t1
MRRLSEIKRVHGDQDSERWIFEATVSPVAQRLPPLFGWRQRSQDAGVDVDVAVVTGVAAKVSTGDGVGRVSLELLALCEVTFR